MAQAKPTARQAEIKRLLAGEVPVGEIARLQKTSAQAVYSQISRMRSLGILPKSARSGGRKSGRPKRAAATGARHTGTRHLPSAEAVGSIAAPESKGDSNGNVSLEDHMAQELERVVKRLAVIEADVSALTAEQTALAERKSRLEAANSHLTGAARPAEAERAPVEAAA